MIIVDGWVFLHTDGGKEGTIRLEDSEGCNPKWVFGTNPDNSIDIEIS